MYEWKVCIWHVVFAMTDSRISVKCHTQSDRKQKVWFLLFTNHKICFTLPICTTFASGCSNLLHLLKQSVSLWIDLVLDWCDWRAAEAILLCLHSPCIPVWCLRLMLGAEMWKEM